MKRALVVVISGTVLWFVALVIEIAVSASTETLWICIVGILFGFLGIARILKIMRRAKT